METLPFPREPANYDEIAMHQSLLFSDSLKDLKNLRQQLYSAAEYFELSYANDDQKQIVVDTLKDYAIKALVNTVDHLGAVSYKVNNLLDEKVEEVSGTELRVSCVEQRLRTCQGYFDHEGVSQQTLLINIPKYHKRYVLPEVVKATISKKHTTLVGKGPSPSPRASQHPELFSFAGTVTRKDVERRSVSPCRFPLLRSGRPTTPNLRPNSRSSTRNPSRPTTPTSITQQQQQQHYSEGRKLVWNGDGEKMMYKEECGGDEVGSKSKGLLKALLSRRKSKKDDMLYTFLDEY